MDKDELMKGFEGLSGPESAQYQLKHWMAGTPLHNPIREECCPDFSCCSDTHEMMPEEVRKRFGQAVAEEDLEAQWSILSMGLGMLAADLSVSVHIAGDPSNEHQPN